MSDFEKAVGGLCSPSIRRRACVDESFDVVDVSEDIARTNAIWLYGPARDPCGIQAMGLLARRQAFRCHVSSIITDTGMPYGFAVDWISWEVDVRYV